MNVVHHYGIWHNNLSKDNIMLHFLLDKLNVVYIAIYDWGKIRHLQEVMPSLYGFTNEQDTTSAREVCWWVTSIFLFCLQKTKNYKFPLMNGQATSNNFGIWNIFDGQASKFVIWGEDWDVEYFVKNSTKMSFRKVIHDMYEPNPEARKIVQHVMRTLMGPPYNWTTLDECY